MPRGFEVVGNLESVRAGCVAAQSLCRMSQVGRVPRLATAETAPSQFLGPGLPLKGIGLNGIIETLAMELEKIGLGLP